MDQFRFSRRTVLRTLSFLAFQGRIGALAAENGSLDSQFAAVEQGIGGRLGVAALDTGTGRRLAYRGAELFAMCSTFKFLLVADVLKRVDAGNESLERLIPYGKKDLLEYAPVTSAHVREGAMSVGDLCAAAIEVSDNTAANLLLSQIGGPAGLTSFIRSLGNQVTRLDRIEPQLNNVAPGDPRDTTTPAAMADSMEKILVGATLSAANRGQLIAWLERCTTGNNRLRAGIPGDWRAGDKTGTGERGAIGDIGIFWPPAKPPVLIAAYLAGGDATSGQREQAIAAAGRIVAHNL